MIGKRPRTEEECRILEKEGEEILKLLDASTDAISDELTKGRIRTIYVQVKYGNKPTIDVANYYSLPVRLIKDIRDGKVFADITGAG